MANQPITYCLLHRADETRQGRNSCLRLQFLAFSLDSIVPLSFLHSISLSSLFTTLSIFGSSDFLQILRRPTAFSLAILCIIVLKLKLVFLGHRRVYTSNLRITKPTNENYTQAKLTAAMKVIQSSYIYFHRPSDWARLLYWCSLVPIFLALVLVQVFIN